jgi:DNA polymerase-3 subunit delta
MHPLEFINNLERQTDVAPVFLFTGEEDFFIEEAWKRLFNKIVPPGAKGFNGERLLAKESTAAQALERLRNVPMFGSKRLLMVRGIESWNKDQRVLLSSYLAHPSPSSCLVLTAAQRKGLEKVESAVKSIGVVFHFSPLMGKDAIRWLQERVRSHQKQFTVQAASLLVEKAGLDMHSLDQEVEKLCTYVGDRNRIEPEDVKAVVSVQRSYTVFELLRFIGRRKSDKAVISLRNLMLSGDPPLGILALLARQIRMIWQVKDGMDRGMPLSHIGQRLNIFSAVLSGYAEQASYFSIEELYSFHERICKADRIMKSSGVAPELVLEALILSLCMGKKVGP